MYNTDIKKLIMQEKMEQQLILDELDPYKLQSLKKAIQNYERTVGP